MIFGDLNKFGIEYLGREGGLEVANVYVAGKNITPIDNSHYKFAATLTFESNRFRDCSELTAWCGSAPGNTLEEKFNHIYQEEFRFKCRVFNWGPPTDDCFFSFIHHENKFYIYGKLDGVREPFGVEVQLSAIIQVLQEAARHITMQSS